MSCAAPTSCRSALLRKLAPVDLVIIEGYKRAPHPKLEVHRAAVGKPLMAPEDPAVVAVAADVPLPQLKVPVVALDDIERVVDLLSRHAVPLTSVAGLMERT
jgi:molybdopterin-guanine dinucleotide biosynthesis protein B